MRRGLASGRRSAKTPTTRNTATMKTAAKAGRPRRMAVARRPSDPPASVTRGVDPGASLPASAQADPGIEPAIEDVDQRVGRDEQDRHHQHRALDERVVALVDGGEEHASEPRD